MRIRKEQIITINKNDIGNDNFEASLKTANRAGFTIVGEMKDKIECRQNLIKNRNLILTETYSGITYEEMVKQREKMNIVIGNLWQIKAEMEMKLGASNLTRELNRYIDKLELYKGLKPDDAVYDSEQVTKRNKL